MKEHSTSGLIKCNHTIYHRLKDGNAVVVGHCEVKYETTNTEKNLKSNLDTISKKDN